MEVIGLADDGSFTMIALPTGPIREPGTCNRAEARGAPFIDAGGCILKLLGPFLTLDNGPCEASMFPS